MTVKTATKRSSSGIAKRGATPHTKLSEVVKLMPCGHAFHINCIQPWFRENADCPLDRRVIIRTDPPLTKSINMKQALMHGIKDGNIEKVAALLAAGTESRGDEFGTRSPLAEALKRGHLSIVKLLLKYDTKPQNSNEQNAVGVALYKGDKSIKPDEAEAVRWFRLAANQGNPEAQYNLALLYHNSNGIAQNSTESLRWLKRSAAQGFAPAHTFLTRLGIAPQ